MAKTEAQEVRMLGANPQDGEIVCGCTNLTMGELRRFLSNDRLKSFDDLLDATGAGTTCTACLLDLEYYFASLQPAAVAAATTPVSSATGGVRHASLKARLYGLLDRLSPGVPVTKTEWMPVIFGDGVEEWFWVANHSLLYRESAAPPIRVGLCVRDADGCERYRVVKDLKEGEVLRLELSRHLKDASPRFGPSGLGIGSVEISRRALRPGKWGTTRPQVEITTARAACAVHSQGPNGQREQWFTCLYRPGEDRVFFSIVNIWSKPLSVEAACLLNDEGSGLRSLAREELVIPPLGSRLCEVTVPAGLAVPATGLPLFLRWRCSGARKIHFFCADPGLSRFSIDHL